MGLYDELTVEMPLSGDERPPDGTVFQTKDLGQAMELWRIAEDGRLYELQRDFEEDGEEWCPLLKMRTPKWRETCRRWLLREHHGLIRFYTAWNGKWWEYEAKFTDGPCVAIRLAECEPLPRRAGAP